MVLASKLCTKSLVSLNRSPMTKKPENREANGHCLQTNGPLKFGSHAPVYRAARSKKPFTNPTRWQIFPEPYVSHMQLLFNCCIQSRTTEREGTIGPRKSFQGGKSRRRKPWMNLLAVSHPSPSPTARIDASAASIHQPNLYPQRKWGSRKLDPRKTK